MPSISKKFVVKISQQDLLKMIAATMPEEFKEHIAGKSVDDIKRFEVDGAAQQVIIEFDEEQTKEGDAGVNTGLFSKLFG